METNRDIDLLIEKQWSEGLSPESEDVLREWVSANEEHRKYYERRILLYRWMGIQQRIPIFEKERKKAYGRFLRSIKGENMPFFFVHKIFSRKLVACAAMVVILLGGGLAVWQQQDKVAEEQVVQGCAREIKVPKGMKERIILADGTKVWLNSRTKIEYPAVFADKERWIKLDGEAYFQVAQNIHKPFIVQTPKGNVEVLGTQFNVESYSDDSTFATALMEGAVKITAGNYQCQLKPNQMAYLKDGEIKVAPIEDYNPYRWREGIISFKDATFPYIIHKFEKYYGVEIRIENKAVMNYRCTGKFRHSDGVRYALRVLQKDVDFQFVRDEENHIIYIK